MRWWRRKGQPDVTDAARLAEQARREFVANVSHELKTPLTNIVGYAETLASGTVEDRATVVKFARVIESNAQQLQHLVNDILHLSAIESGRLDMNLTIVPLYDIVKEVEERSQGFVARGRLQVKNGIPLGITVMADRFALQQVIGNLLDNAIKYTPDGGTIFLNAVVQGDRCLVSVEDTGIGIAPEYLPRIFERFYRVDRGRSREVGGTGLGLAIVKHLTQAMGGEVRVESEQGKGTRFFFTLPIA